MRLERAYLRRDVERPKVNGTLGPLCNAAAHYAAPVI